MMSFKNSNTSKLVFVASLIVFLFWFLGLVINVYKVAVVGVIYEIVWLPIILLTLGLPVVSLIAWYKEKFNMRSLYFYSLIVLAATILHLTFISK
jgi:hypothetical protein